MHIDKYICINMYTHIIINDLPVSVDSRHVVLISRQSGR